MTYKKISVLVPTRHRLNRLNILLDSYYQTTQDAEACSELIFRVDEDDQETQVFLSEHPHRVVVGHRLSGYRSLPTFFNEMAAVITGDVLMSGNDDIVFKTPHWAPKILEIANQYQDGLFDIGVKAFNEDHYPYCITSRKVVECLGF